MGFYSITTRDEVIVTKFERKAEMNSVIQIKQDQAVSRKKYVWIISRSEQLLLEMKVTI